MPGGRRTLGPVKVMLAALLDSVATPRPCESIISSWWTRASALSAAAADSNAPGTCYRFGDRLLEVASDSPELLGELEQRYGECAVQVPQSACARCFVRSCEENRLALVRYSAPAGIDLCGVALTLLQHPVAHPIFVEGARTQDGWRLIVRAETGVPVAAARAGEALIDRTCSPSGFLVDLIVNPMLAAQRELLFVHAASVGIGGAGILLIGPSGSGKTTVSLALASRGHAYFGDDMAAIRMSSMELLPFRSTACVRPGPHARALSRHLDTASWEAPHADGICRLAVRVRDLFPAAAAGSLELRAAVFLRRFAPAPAVERFAPTFAALGSSSRLALNNALWIAWGTTPQRRLLQFMLFVRMLTRVHCAWLDVGHPERTADLLERTMEATWT